MLNLRISASDCILMVYTCHTKVSGPISLTGLEHLFKHCTIMKIEPHTRFALRKRPVILPPRNAFFHPESEAVLCSVPVLKEAQQHNLYWTNARRTWWKYHFLRVFHGRLCWSITQSKFCASNSHVLITEVLERLGHPLAIRSTPAVFAERWAPASDSYPTVASEQDNHQKFTRGEVSDRTQGTLLLLLCVSICTLIYSSRRRNSHM